MNEEQSTQIEGVIRISSKEHVFRRAIASGQLTLKQETKEAILKKQIRKGDVLQASTVAVIQAVKETPRIIPHCHPLPLEGCQVDWSWDDAVLTCTVTVEATYKTGVEMEALTGVSAGLLCVFDMVKSFEKDEHGMYPSATIDNLHVVSKEKMA